MLTEKDLKEKIVSDWPLGPTSATWSFEDLEWHIHKLASQEGIALNTQRDEIKTGGVFKNTTVPCLILTSVDHEKGYYQVCILADNRSLDVYLAGTSKQHGLIEKQQKAKFNRAKRAEFLSHRWENAGLFGAVATITESAMVNAGSVAMSGVRALQRSDDALREEEEFYAQCIELIKTAVRQ